MELTKEQQREFEDAVRPVIQWLNNNCHPHNSIIITNLSAEIVCGEYMYRTEDYLLD